MKKTIVIVYDGAVINGGAAKIAIQSAVELAKNPDINMIYFAANCCIAAICKAEAQERKRVCRFCRKLYSAYRKSCKCGAAKSIGGPGTVSGHYHRQ